MGGLGGVFGLGTNIMVQIWSVDWAGSLQLEDAALVLGGVCSGHPVGYGSADGRLVGLLVSLGMGTDRAVQRWLVDFASASTWLVSGVL